MKRFRFFALMCFMAAFLIWLGGFIIFSNYIQSYRTDYETHTDAVAVLTGGRNRIAEAVKIFNDGLADSMIISGVGRHVTLEQLEVQNHSQITTSNKNIVLGDQAKNTIENAIEVREIIRRRDIKSLRLVTSFYHMPRSEQEIWAQNPDIEIIAHPVYSNYVSVKWWKNWRSFKLIVSEYTKFVFVYLKNFAIKLMERD